MKTFPDIGQKLQRVVVRSCSLSLKEFSGMFAKSKFGKYITLNKCYEWDDQGNRQ